MVGGFFAADIFSRSQPKFECVSSSVFSEISRVIGTYYSSLEDKVISVEQLSGLEVNSKNFRVMIGSHVYALKQIGNPDNIQAFNTQLAISQELLNNGIQFPRIVNDDDGALLSFHEDGRFWVLTEFIEGNYFSGCSKQFFTIADAIGSMQNTLESIVSRQHLPVWASAETWKQTKKMLFDLIDRKEEWSTLFPTLEYNLLIEEYDSLVNSFYQVVDHIPNFHYSTVPSHIDLHPHNILIAKCNVPIFVDVDSLQLTDRTQCLAFTTYKLARQNVVYEGFASDQRTIEKATKKFVNKVVQAANLEHINVADFPLAAKIEILHRIAIVTDYHIHKKYRQTNPILQMQLIALREIPLIFSGFL